MDNKTCTVCNTEKHINNFYKKYSESKDYNFKRGVNRYHDNKDKISVQQKIYYEKRDKLLQKQNDYKNKRNTDYKELLRSYVEIQFKLKTMEGNLKIRYKISTITRINVCTYKKILIYLYVYTNINVCIQYY